MELTGVILSGADLGFENVWVQADPTPAGRFGGVGEIRRMRDGRR